MPDVGAYQAIRTLPSRGASTLTLAKDPSAPDQVVLLRSLVPPETWDAATTRRATEAFFESASLQKELADDSPHWAKVIEIDRAARTVVSDYFERSVDWLLERRVALKSEDLRNILDSALAGLAKLFSARSRGHGNLKSSNILVGRSNSIAAAPVALCDPAVDAEAPAGVTEQKDLLTLGALIYQLITHQKFNEVDHYPIAPKRFATALDRQAEGWRRVCNKLLDPLAPATLTRVEEIRADLRRMRIGRKRMLTAAAVVPLVLIGVGLVAFLYGRGEPKLTPSQLRENWELLCDEYHVWGESFVLKVLRGKRPEHFAAWKERAFSMGPAVIAEKDDAINLRGRWEEKYRSKDPDGSKTKGELDELIKVRKAVDSWAPVVSLRSIPEGAGRLHALSQEQLKVFDRLSKLGEEIEKAAPRRVPPGTEPFGEGLVAAVEDLERRKEEIAKAAENWKTFSDRRTTLASAGGIFFDFTTFAQEQLAAAPDLPATAEALAKLTDLATRLSANLKLDLNVEEFAKALPAQANSYERFESWLKLAPDYQRPTPENLTPLRAARAQVEQKLAEANRKIGNAKSLVAADNPQIRGFMDKANAAKEKAAAVAAPAIVSAIPKAVEDVNRISDEVAALDGAIVKWESENKEVIAKAEVDLGKAAFRHAAVNDAWKRLLSVPSKLTPGERVQWLRSLEGAVRELDQSVKELEEADGREAEWSEEFRQLVAKTRDTALFVVCQAIVGGTVSPTSVMPEWHKALEAAQYEPLRQKIRGLYADLRVVGQGLEGFHLPDDTPAGAPRPLRKILEPHLAEETFANLAGEPWAKILQRIRQLDAIAALGTRTELLDRIESQQAEPVYRVAAWRRLAQGNAPPARFADYAREVEVVQKTDELLGVVKDTSHRTALRGLLPAERPRSLWLEYFPLAPGGKEIEAMVRQAPGLHISNAQVEDGRARFNFLVAELLFKLPPPPTEENAEADKKNDRLVVEFIEGAKALEKVHPTIAPLLDDLRAPGQSGGARPAQGMGPRKADGWERREEGRNRLRFTKEKTPAGAQTIEFALVNVDGVKRAWVSTTEISLGMTTAAASNWPKTSQSWKTVDGQFRVSVKRGMRAWRHDERRLVAPNTKWGIEETPFFANNPAVSYYAPNVTFLRSDADYPVHFIKPEVAWELAWNGLGCRLPTVAEFRAAARQEIERGKSGIMSLLSRSNLRDTNWLNQANYCEGKGDPGNYVLPHFNSFNETPGLDIWLLPRPYNDGSLWTWPVKQAAPNGVTAPPGTTFLNLVGNVSEYVLAAPLDRELGALLGKPEMLPRARILSLVGQTRVLGASALSPPLPPKTDLNEVFEPQPLKVPDGYFSDVGFRIAFDASPASMVAVARMMLEGEDSKGPPYLLPATAAVADPNR